MAGLIALTLVGGATAVAVRLAGGGGEDPVAQAPTATPTPGVQPTPDPTDTAAPAPCEWDDGLLADDPACHEPRAVEFTILGAGDVLIHMPVHHSATVDGVTDFTPLLAGVNEWVAGADLAICHLEVPLIRDDQEATGFPLFGARRQLAFDLVEQGWDGCSFASNHTIDRGVEGMIHSMDTFDEAGLGHAGAGRTEIEADAPQLYKIERDGRVFTIAQISTTYGLNGLVLPADMQWAVHMNNIDEIIDRATRAREAGADMVFLSLHDGWEYHAVPSPQQQEIAYAMAQSGVIDFIFGHHAHVPQRMELLPGGVHGDGMWVAYGLGNMLSNQFASTLERYGIPGAARTSQGLFAIATITAEPDGPPRVTNMEWAAHTVCRDSGHRMHMLNDLLADPSRSQIPASEVAYRNSLVRHVMEYPHENRTTATERLTPPVPTGPPPVVVRRPQ